MHTCDSILGTDVTAHLWARPAAPHRLIQVKGADAVSFLHRLCSQDIEGLAPGVSGPASFLNAKGKVLVTCRVGRTDDGIWLETSAPQAGELVSLLDRYRFT